jgi:hypothetical protein
VLAIGTQAVAPVGFLGQLEFIVPTSLDSARRANASRDRRSELSERSRTRYFVPAPASACSLSPRAPTTFRIVSKPGLRSPDKALYRLSRDKPASLAT